MIYCHELFFVLYICGTFSLLSIYYGFFFFVLYIFMLLFFLVTHVFFFKFTIIVINNKLVIGHDILKIYTSTKLTEPYM